MLFAVGDAITIVLTIAIAIAIAIATARYVPYHRGTTGACHRFRRRTSIHSPRLEAMRGWVGRLAWGYRSRHWTQEGSSGRLESLFEFLEGCPNERGSRRSSGRVEIPHHDIQFVVPAIVKYWSSEDQVVSGDEGSLPSSVAYWSSRVT